jgi:hypothetical protein
METAPGPPKHEKYCFDIACPKSTEMHYVTPISHQMQILKFSIMYPGALFMDIAPGPPEHKK